jgi:integrase
MAIFRRGGVWWYEFRFDNQRVRESTHQSNANVARQAEAADRLRRVRGEHGIARKDKAPTLEEFAATFNEWVTSEKDNQRTREFYAICYQRLLDYKPLGNARLDKIDQNMIEKFKLWALAKELSRTTVNRYLTTLRKTLRYAMRKRELIDRVPVIELYPNERGRKYVFTDSDFEHWLEVAGEPLRSASVLARDCGVCRGEMLALERDCVVLRDSPDARGFWGTLKICRGLKRPSRLRDLSITQDMAVVLHRLLAESKCSHVFTALEDHSQPLSRNTLASQQQQMKKLAGEFDSDAGMHALRHTFLTDAGKYTQNVKALQLLAGHANISTTMKYVHPAAQDVIETQHRAHAAREARILAGLTRLPTEVPTVQ